MIAQLNKITSILPIVWQGACMTIFMTTIIVTAGLIGGFVSGFITCEKIRVKWLTPIIRVLEFIILGTPVFVQFLIFYFILPRMLHTSISPAFAGIVTLSLTAISRFAEIVRHDIDQIPDGQWESCRVLGYSLPLILRSVVFPQVLRSSFASFIGESIVLLKETYIVSILGTVELTKVAMNLGSRDLDPLTAYILIAFVYLAIVGALTYLAHIVQARFLKNNHNATD